MNAITLGIDGMHCGACVGTIQNALEAVAGVQSAIVSLEAGTATIKFDPAITDNGALPKAVMDAGYAIRSGIDAGAGKATATGGGCGASGDKKKSGCCCG